jgi:hypothetical protein
MALEPVNGLSSDGEVWTFLDRARLASAHRPGVAVRHAIKATYACYRAAYDELGAAQAATGETRPAHKTGKTRRP